MKVYIGEYPENGSEREVTIIIDPYDTWSMDNTLSLIVHPMLIQLKKTMPGAPFTDDEDVPAELRSTSAPPKENEWDTDELFAQRWNWIMDEMIHAHDPEWDDKFEWDYENNEPIEEYDKRRVRRKNGFRLFGKYYQALWD